MRARRRIRIKPARATRRPPPQNRAIGGRNRPKTAGSGPHSPTATSPHTPPRAPPPRRSPRAQGRRSPSEQTPEPLGGRPTTKSQTGRPLGRSDPMFARRQAPTGRTEHGPDIAAGPAHHLVPPPRPRGPQRAAPAGGPAGRPEVPGELMARSHPHRPRTAASPPRVPLADRSAGQPPRTGPRAYALSHTALGHAVSGRAPAVPSARTLLRPRIPLGAAQNAARRPHTGGSVAGTRPARPSLSTRLPLVLKRALLARAGRPPLPVGSAPHAARCAAALHRPPRGAATAPLPPELPATPATLTPKRSRHGPGRPRSGVLRVAPPAPLRRAVPRRAGRGAPPPRRRPASGRPPVRAPPRDAA